MNERLLFALWKSDNDINSSEVSFVCPPLAFLVSFDFDKLSTMPYFEVNFSYFIWHHSFRDLKCELTSKVQSIWKNVTINKQFQVLRKESITQNL